MVICAFTELRWEMLGSAVKSILRQSLPPAELIVCIDHNKELFDRCGHMLEEWNRESNIPVRVIENAYSGRLGSARNSALDSCTGQVVAFLDDDAEASEHWLDHLLAPYARSNVVAVGGAPLPAFESPRPMWFPPQCDWVFGCYYDGLPKQLSEVPRLIGAAMSARRSALIEIGGFHSDNHDDMDMCHRLKATFPTQEILMEPLATVLHHVVSERVTWSYFWRRCFYVNKGKVKAFRDMGDAASIDADRDFALGAIARSGRLAMQGIYERDLTNVVRFTVLLAGISIAVMGNLMGRVTSWR